MDLRDDTMLVRVKMSGEEVITLCCWEANGIAKTKSGL